MQTLAEMWEQQGYEKGYALGYAQGFAQGLEEARLEGMRDFWTRQLRLRFGELPASVLARIEQADEAALQRWEEALFDAPSLDALFPSSCG